MHFTREPIIETVITARDGFKLLVRSSKGEERGEFFVDALEVVSFGHSHFFRSPERPNSFLLPVSDYEVLETKDMKMPLKLGGGEKAQKIAIRPQQREAEEGSSEEASEQPSERYEKKRDRRRGRRRRGSSGPGMEMRSEAPSHEPQSQMETEMPLEHQAQDQGVETGGDVAPSFISKLFPPPPTLIKETLSRYKVNEDEDTALLEERAEDLLGPESPEDQPPESDEESDEEYPKD